ncbi:MAG: sulfatase/phosphatase domain-containing protein, partial [Akkermansiaceae bacterium]
VEIDRPKLSDPKYFDMQPDFLKNSLNRVRWHWRWDTPEKYQTNMRAYFRMLTGMDQVIARVQKEIKAHGLEKNTIVIYTADNGFYMGNRGFAGKWSHYEESLRVPMIIFDPRAEGSSKGRTFSQLVTNLDLPATMLDLAGVEIPKKYQGESLVPFLRGDHPAKWREDFFNEFHSSNKKLANWRGVHAGRYTYARYYQQQPIVEMLYDLKSDPDQLINLVSDPKHAKILKQMRSRVDDYKEQYTRPEIEKLRWPEKRKLN